MITTLFNKIAFFTNPTPKISRPSFTSSSSSKAPIFPSNINFKFTFDSSFKCFCSETHNAHHVSSRGFSALAEDNLPWDTENLWSTMALYMFSLHVPLSFGWISIASEILQQHNLDPQTRAISLFVVQNVELAATISLLKLTAKQQCKFEDLLKPTGLSQDRNWFLASALGFGFLFALVVVTSFLINIVFEPKASNNLAVKEILLGNNSVSKASIVGVYCVIAPVLEETVYRGFLLRSLLSKMQWQKAVLISSAVFSAAHLSGESFIQLSIVGCVLGSSYCWTGNLASSIAIHSCYNAMTLVITFLY